MLKEYLSNIADQFRTHLDTTEPINAQDFAGKIEDVALKHNLSGFASGKEVGIEQGKLELLRDSEYMNAKVSGTAISVNDVNSIEHSVGVQLKSKNLLNAFDIKNSGGSNAFDTFEQSEGCVTVTSDNSTVRNVSFNLLNKYLQKGNYILSFDIECENSVTTSGNCDCIYIWHNDVFKTARSLKNDGQNGSIVYKFTLTETTHVKIIWYKSVTDYVTNNTIYKAILSNIQLEIGTTATEYTPYVAELGGIEVSRLGKNLFDIDTVLPSFINGYGEAGKWIKQSDGSYFKRNVGTGYGDIWFENMANYKGQMTMSVTSKYKRTDVGGYGLGLVIEYTDGTKYSLMTPITLEYSVTVVVTNANKTVSNIWQTYDSGEGMYVKDIMIAYGSDTTYEPYIKPATYTAKADGTVKGVTSLSPNMTLLTNNNGVVINANYLRDIDTYIDNLITDIALSGGEA